MAQKNIDRDVVSLTFDVGKFEQGAEKVLKASNKVNESLKFQDAGKGLENVTRAANAVNLGHISRSVDEVSRKLNVFRIAAAAVIAHVAIQAEEAGVRIVKAFSFGPIIQGFQEYSTNLNAVQTILANTEASGATLKDVNAALLQLNKYSDETIYNFSEMARNIGTFTAAGVDLKTATGAIKGIANLAALSGSNSQQASTAMYQLSQAISAGRVSLQDWNSVVNAGMGGTVFQRALANTAVQMGKLKESSLKLVGPMKNVSIHGESFRQSIQSGPGKKSWLTSDVLTKTLQQFTGDLTDAQLKAEGFNEQQIKAIQQTAKTAREAATQVKTISQLMEVTKETIGSGWSQTFQLIFGDFGEAKTLFTGMSNAINAFVNRNAHARNQVLKVWKKLGGRDVLISAFKQAFQDLGEVLKPIKQAFRDIFPKRTGRDLYDLTTRLLFFVNSIKPAPQTIDNMRRTFRGLFALLDIGKKIVVGIFDGFKALFGAIGVGQGGILSFTGDMGDLVVRFDKFLEQGNKVTVFFQKLGLFLAAPVRALLKLKDALLNLFSGFSAGGISTQAKALGKAMSPLQKIVEGITKAWQKFVDVISGSASSFSPELDNIVASFQNLGPAISEAIKNMNVEAILQVIRTGLLAGMFLLIRNFFGGKGGFFRANTKINLFSVIFKGLDKPLNALTGSLQAMQTNIKSRTLKNIAISIALLAVSVVALSLADPDRVSSAISALTIMFVELLGAMKVLDTIVSSTSFLRLPIATAAMIGLAIAIDLLTISVLALSRLSWDQLTRGLSGVAVLMGGLVAISGPLSKASPRLILAGAGLTAIAVGLNIMALAIRQLGSMDLSALAKGLGAVAVGLIIITAAVKLIPISSIITGAGLIEVAFALNLLAAAVFAFGKMDLKTIGKGLLGIAGSLVAIGAAMHLMPINMPITAAGLILVSIALQGIARSVSNMGKLPIKVIAKGILALAGSLAVLALGLQAMSGAIGGAIALGIAAAGIALLTPALVALGKQSGDEIARELIALAAAFAILGIAGATLAPVTPALIGLGAALVLIGGGLALAGAGIFLIGAGLASVAIAGPTAVAILIKALNDFIAATGEMGKNLVLGLLEIVKTFAEVAPQFVDAVVKIVDSILQAIILSAPKIGQAAEVLITTILKVLRDKSPDIIATGFQLLLDLLTGLKQNTKQLVAAGVDILVNFLKGISSQINRVIRAGVDIILSLIRGITSGLLRLINEGAKAIVKFLNGVADAIDKYEPQIFKAGIRIGVALVTGMIKGLAQEVGALFSKIADISKKMLDKIKHPWKIFSPSQVTEEVGKNIIGGLTKGIQKVGPLYDKVKEIGKKLLDTMKHPWKIFSPSQVTEEMGYNIIQGLTKGIKDNSDEPANAAKDMSKKVVKAMKDTFQIAAKGSFGITPEGSAAILKQLNENIATFSKGIHGSTGEIRQAFKDLDSELFDAASSARQTIADENDKIKQEFENLQKLSKHPKKNAKDIAESNKAIAESQKTIRENQAVIDKATAAHNRLTQAIKTEKPELIALSIGYERINARLEKANQALADAKQMRDDAFKSFKEQYSQLPEIDTQLKGTDQLNQYEKALETQADAIAAYKKTLDQLKKLGLDDVTYKKLLSEGVVDQAFADALLAGGKDAVDELNKFDKNLMSKATDLAKDASQSLYQAGVDAAQGMVDGLKAGKKQIQQVMDEIADAMVARIKSQLKIKSPSEIFSEIGQFTMEGLAKGLIASSKAVTDAVYMVSEDAMGAMSNSLSKIPDVISSEIDVNPTITPILDLTNVQNGSKKLGSILDVAPITINAAKIQGSINATQISQDKAATPTSPEGDTNITFNQTNNSPKALDDVEIYRNTRNQISQLRTLTRG